MSSGNRRRWDRVESLGMTIKAVVDGDRGRVELNCTLRDYSEEGLGLTVAHHVPALSPIRLIIGEDCYEGEVRYCRKTIRGLWEVGVRIFVA